MEKKRIFFLSNAISSYQYDFLSNLNKKVLLRCFFLKKKINNFNWNFKKTTWYNINKNFFSLLNDIKKNKTNLLIIGGYRIKFSIIFLIYSRLNKLKLYFWLEKIQNSNKILFTIKRIYFSIILRLADGIIAIGSEANTFYKNYNSNVFNLPYSINVFKFKKKNYKLKKKITFFFTGQLIDRKGIIELIEAFIQLPSNDCILKIAGIGPHKSTIENICLKEKNILYLGFLSQKELIKNLSTSDVFILPSKHDGWGAVITEAMAAGLPVIGTNYASAFKDLIIDNYNGKKCDPYSIKSIKNSMTYYIKNKSKIKTQGIKNRKIIINSLCETRKAVNYLLEKI